MLSFAAGLALLVTQQPPRLRTLLDNGAVVLVEPVPSTTISVQLFASSKYAPETEATHGYRHLLEHLIARGDGTLDRRLESQGCFLIARTLRDAMQIEITVGPSQLNLALDALREVLRKPAITQEAIDHEMRVMRDELAMQDDSALLASCAWQIAYGEGGLDPLGTFDSMYRATPDKLMDVFDRQFAGDGLALVVTGPVDLDGATKLASALIGTRAKGRNPVTSPEREGKPGRGTASAIGQARGAMVPSFNTPKTAAALAAALAIAGQVRSTFVTYTPSIRPGVITLGRTDYGDDLGAFVDAYQPDAGEMARGKALAREWVQRQLQNPSGSGFLRGLLLCQDAGSRPEQLLKQIDDLTLAEFQLGASLFTSERAAVAVGDR